MTESGQEAPGSQLVGREAETKVLGSLLDRLHDQGGAVLVSGSAGIGKSALLDDIRRRAEASGLRTDQARCLRSRRGVDGGPAGPRSTRCRLA